MRKIPEEARCEHIQNTVAAVYEAPEKETLFCGSARF
jgi:hypothetical protein